MGSRARSTLLEEAFDLLQFLVDRPLPFLERIDILLQGLEIVGGLSQAHWRPQRDDGQGREH